jgi:IS5 family transposase
VRAALEAPLPTGANRPARRLREHRDRFLPLVRQVIAQARRRVLAGETVPATEQRVSLFAPHTRVVPRHKGGAAVECGRLAVFDGVAGGIVPRLAVLADETAAHGERAPA